MTSFVYYLNKSRWHLKRKCNFLPFLEHKVLIIQIDQVKVDHLVAIKLFVLNFAHITNRIQIVFQ